MRYYENLFIVNPNYEQDRLSKLLDSVKNEIEKLNGKVLVTEDWGKRRLAYTINKHRYGNYVLFQYSTENSSVTKELEQWMKLNTAILSCMTVRLKKEPTLQKDEGAPKKDLNKSENK